MKPKLVNTKNSVLYFCGPRTIDKELQVRGAEMDILYCKTQGRKKLTGITCATTCKLGYIPVTGGSRSTTVVKWQCNKSKGWVPNMKKRGKSKLNSYGTAALIGNFCGECTALHLLVSTVRIYDRSLTMTLGKPSQCRCFQRMSKRPTANLKQAIFGRRSAVQLLWGDSTYPSDNTVAHTARKTCCERRFPLRVSFVSPTHTLIQSGSTCRWVSHARPEVMLPSRESSATKEHLRDSVDGARSEMVRLLCALYSFWSCPA